MNSRQNTENIYSSDWGENKNVQTSEGNQHLKEIISG